MKRNPFYKQKRPEEWGRFLDAFELRLQGYTNGEIVIKMGRKSGQADGEESAERLVSEDCVRAGDIFDNVFRGVFPGVYSREVVGPRKKAMDIAQQASKMMKVDSGKALKLFEKALQIDDDCGYARLGIQEVKKRWG